MQVHPHVGRPTEIRVFDVLVVTGFIRGGTRHIRGVKPVVVGAGEPELFVQNVEESQVLQQPKTRGVLVVQQDCVPVVQLVLYRRGLGEGVLHGVGVEVEELRRIGPGVADDHPFPRMSWIQVPQRINARSVVVGQNRGAHFAEQTVIPSLIVTIGDVVARRRVVFHVVHIHRLVTPNGVIRGLGVRSECTAQQRQEEQQAHGKSRGLGDWFLPLRQCA